MTTLCGRSFPPDFLQRVTHSGRQVGGTSDNSDTWFAELVDPAVFKEPSGPVCHDWELWREDTDLAMDLGLHAYRFSVEWARVEPTEGTFDEEALAHYEASGDHCLEVGLAPVVTFNHFTSPHWFAMKSSWLNPEALELFARYCDKVMERFGDRIAVAVTLNEPNLTRLLAWMDLPDFVHDLERATAAVTRREPLTHRGVGLTVCLAQHRQPWGGLVTDTVDRPASTSEDEPSPPSVQRSLPLDRVVFGTAGVAVLAFVVWGALQPEAMGRTTTSTLGWLENSFGWLFVLTTAGFVVFSAYLALSRYGNIKLGPDDSEPEFSTFSWVSMMFATGMGIGLIFWGVAEPLTHLNTPPLGLAEPGTPGAARLAIEYTFFHWGLHPWSIYAVIGLAIAYFAYRKGYGNLISGTFRPLIGDAAGRAPGKAIDIVAIIATLFGSATSLGLGALQITGGLDNVFDGSGESVGLALLVIWVLTACFVLSAVTGIEKGVQFLSNANAIAAVVLVCFLFVVGPTVFILSTFTEGMGAYITQLPTMSGRTGAFDADQAAWLNGWTIFYWAWWVSWTPFVGMFIARISKGRTIRQFVAFVIVVPSMVSFVWFSILGGSAFDLQLNQGKDLGQQLADEGTESILFTVLRDYPLASVTVVLAIFLIAIFFITGADSASIVMGMLSQHGEEEPRRWLVIFWGVAQGAVASVLLWSGGDDLRAGLTALQNLVIIVGGAFMLVIIAMCFSLMKSLRAESYESTLPTRLRKAVLHVQQRKEEEQHAIALTALGADHPASMDDEEPPAGR